MDDNLLVRFSIIAREINDFELFKTIIKTKVESRVREHTISYFLTNIVNDRDNFVLYLFDNYTDSFHHQIILTAKYSSYFSSVVNTLDILNNNGRKIKYKYLRSKVNNRLYEDILKK